MYSYHKQTKKERTYLYVMISSVSGDFNNYSPVAQHHTYFLALFGPRWKKCIELQSHDLLCMKNPQFLMFSTNAGRHSTPPSLPRNIYLED